MTDYIKQSDVNNTFSESNSFLDANHAKIIATYIASFSAGWAATRMDFELPLPNQVVLNDLKFNISVVGNGSTNYNVEVKNFETYFTGISTTSRVVYENGKASTVYNIGGLPTLTYPLLTSFVAIANQPGAPGRLQTSQTIEGMYLGVNPVGSTGGRLTISNTAAIPAAGGETLYITVRKF